MPNSYQPTYSRAFTERREAAQAAAEAQRQEDIAENERLGARRLAALAAKRAADEAANDARLEAALEPERARLERLWLSEHPDRTPGDFARRAWPLLRLNLADERASEHLEAQKRALARSGAYGL